LLQGEGGRDDPQPQEAKSQGIEALTAPLVAAFFASGAYRSFGRGQPSGRRGLSAKRQASL
jgi:hypothetical protein